MTMTCVAFIERIEYQMNIEPGDGHSVAEIVEGLNAGRYEIRGDKGAVIERGTWVVVAYIHSYEATVTDVVRCEFAKVRT